MTNQRPEEVDMQIDRINLETGALDSVISPEEALNKLVPAYYIDRAAAAQDLRAGAPLSTTAFEYRRHKVLKFEFPNSIKTQSSKG